MKFISASGMKWPKSAFGVSQAKQIVNKTLLFLFIDSVQFGRVIIMNIFSDTVRIFWAKMAWARPPA